MQIEGLNKMPEHVLRSDVKKEFTEFIQKFRADSGEYRYVQAVRNALNNGKHHIVFGFNDLFKHNQDLAQLIFSEYYKYEPVINEALTSYMAEQIRNCNTENRREEEVVEKFECSFDCGFTENSNNFSVRGLKCNNLGKLIRMRGTVTRTSQVRPELKVGVFKCRNCGKLSKEVVQQFKYTEPKRCMSENCDKGSWELQMGKCQFADFQKIRVQEDPTKIPPGAMPRSIDVILRNQFTERGQPGDICEIVGYLCVLPQLSSMLKPGEKTQLTTRSNQTRGIAHTQGGISGLKGIRDLSYKLIFTGVNIKVQNNQFDDLLPEQNDDDQQQRQKDVVKAEFDESKIWDKVYSSLTSTQIQSIVAMKENNRLYQDIAESLFPTIYGHQQIKKALLLQLIGGIHKRTQNKISIRGDINILIVGDPSSAKSQFLKCVNKFVPRSVYTNGKTTSAAGLTASVTRDQSGNVGIEAGALMLADNGICCIDEFDKMEIKDQVAIHQAMEQQTISIAKAGVYATLNARTSILAAANPIFGRYDKAKSLKNNIQLSAPIMSRFDLFFVVCDESNAQMDRNLSQFIINIHRLRQPSIQPKYPIKKLKDYISVTRKIKPQLVEESADLLRRYYIEIRSKDKNNSNSYRVTVRQLESMIRLSEAYARLELSLKVLPRHVKEAYRLLSCSILKLQKPSIELQDPEMQQVGMAMGRINIRDEKLQQHQRRLQEQKKNKVMKISHQLYLSLQGQVKQLFKKKKKLHEDEKIDEEQQISQDDICNYLLAGLENNGMVSSLEDTEPMKKLVNAVIKKLIRQERMLMIVEDSNDLTRRMLQMHPNFVEQ